MNNPRLINPPSNWGGYHLERERSRNIWGFTTWINWLKNPHINNSTVGFSRICYRCFEAWAEWGWSDRKCGCRWSDWFRIDCWRNKMLLSPQVQVHSQVWPTFESFDSGSSLNLPTASFCIWFPEPTTAPAQPEISCRTCGSRTTPRATEGSPRRRPPLCD